MVTKLAMVATKPKIMPIMLSVDNPLEALESVDLMFCADMHLSAIEVRGGCGAQKTSIQKSR